MKGGFGIGRALPEAPRSRRGLVEGRRGLAAAGDAGGRRRPLIVDCWRMELMFLAWLKTSVGEGLGGEGEGGGELKQW